MSSSHHYTSNEEKLYAKISTYVDDMPPTLANKPRQGSTLLQDSLSHVSEWAATSGVHINPPRSAWQWDLADRETTLKLDNDPMSRSAEVNLSGVIKSGDLKWFADARKTVSKFRIKVLPAVQLKAFGASREDLLRIWTTFARPLLVNMQPRSWAHLSQTWRQSNEKDYSRRP